MNQAASPDRLLARRGRHLEYLTLAWNSLEGLLAVIFGAFAGSTSLVGFGLDSVIELASGTALLWRMSVDANADQRERSETRALQVVGVCFFLLAAYLTYESAAHLFLKRTQHPSLPGIVLACASLLVMPLLSRAKRKVGHALGSRAMRADAKQSEFCAYLSAILLAGLLTNTLFHYWWADPVAALIMVPIIANEGFEAFRGKKCAHCEPLHLA